MCNSDNFKDLVGLPVNWVGMIFYEASSRYVEANKSESDKISAFDITDSKIKKIGVFVDEGEALILEKAKKYDLSFIQLHGSKSIEICKNIKQAGLSIIKAFAISDEFDFQSLEEYEPYCDYFLFDTKGKLPGGNGYTFNWELLEKYKLETPFLLSGGISPEHVDDLKEFQHPRLVGIDLNSRFEIEPGLKDITKLKKFIDEFRSVGN